MHGSYFIIFTIFLFTFFLIFLRVNFTSFPLCLQYLFSLSFFTLYFFSLSFYPYRFLSTFSYTLFYYSSIQFRSCFLIFYPSFFPNLLFSYHLLPISFILSSLLVSVPISFHLIYFSLP